ncbi:MAG: phosphatase PAP2 family protein [Coriobacteriia bacterium]|nr:phosphatase PAP2 family protein [Coriobacteriia bacterium]
MDFAGFAGFDAAIDAALRTVASPALMRVMWLATVSGDAAVMTVWTALAVVLLWAWGRRRQAVVLAVMMSVEPLLVSALKQAFSRPRPPLADMLVAPPSGLSFPSGHATAALLFYGLLALFALLGDASGRRKASMVAGALGAAFLVGVSRVYLGVHFPSDVVAGWLVAGVLIALGGSWLALWRHVGGPEHPLKPTPARRAGMDAALALAAALAAGALFLQACSNPLL